MVAPFQRRSRPRNFWFANRAARRRIYKLRRLSHPPHHVTSYDSTSAWGTWGSGTVTYGSWDDPAWTAALQSWSSDAPDNGWGPGSDWGPSNTPSDAAQSAWIESGGLGWGPPRD
ncbi:hypothetical protein C8F04DRAFT_1175224 [Mycena alexandri]|uniref:Uncharacterized protein n=1 Tax=Mycena alexandri TaxID=1745969 RepID=A0AAD6XGA8_9AGAR|nr:hypothetical protein C8F04DRAFT_1175224 [Mycena alexandri]